MLFRAVDENRFAVNCNRRVYRIAGKLDEIAGQFQRIEVANLLNVAGAVDPHGGAFIEVSQPNLAEQVCAQLERHVGAILAAGYNDLALRTLVGAGPKRGHRHVRRAVAALGAFGAAAASALPAAALPSAVDLLRLCRSLPPFLSLTAAALPTTGVGVLTIPSLARPSTFSSRRSSKWFCSASFAFCWARSLFCSSSRAFCCSSRCSSCWIDGRDPVVPCRVYGFASARRVEGYRDQPWQRREEASLRRLSLALRAGPHPQDELTDSCGHRLVSLPAGHWMPTFNHQPVRWLATSPKPSKPL